ncbi:hypothetical protein K788_0004254 (plasmid) [Paraburkholderia caribensis MBA4]|uniref:Uncharacterized protein n=1 Tax=Paraburkholderia caribensis MBA4 TaxID=1323664 RepID=A0A0P0RP94_9BURK|nr:hypothetical protein [Paraburkholderia caribensis]ALL70780.1 hypothetical protein K788_0004254 [Paraburkholderia caribensis MBA4]
MGRLIELRLTDSLPGTLHIETGDVLTAAAMGGHVLSGSDVLEFLGPFLPGTMGEDGHVITPAGLPNGIMFVARRAGRATIDLVAGDWQAQRFFILDVVVEAGDV